MTFVGVCSKAMLKVPNVKAGRIWRSAHDCASGRQLVTPTLVSARALAASNALISQVNKSRFLNSFTPQEEKKTLFDLCNQDMKKIEDDGKRMIRDHIKNDEMYEIATYYYLGEGTGLFMGISSFVLLSKALSYHLRRDGNLTGLQEKVISLLELGSATIIMHDDIIDNTQVRCKIPTAHRVWNPYKVIVAGDMMTAIFVNEAAKLDYAITSTLCLLNERAVHGQCVSNDNNMTIPSYDTLANYLLQVDLKAGSSGSFMCKSVAQASGASDLLAENVLKMGFNAYMAIQVVDDLKDLEADITDGVATAPVLFALKEHPVLEKMIGRKFREEGDVEKAMELVNNSNGKEQAKILVRTYFEQAMYFLDTLADSPYREGLKNFLHVQLNRKINK